MCPSAKVNGVLALQRRVAAYLVGGGQTPRNVASILDSARELGIRDAQAAGVPTRFLHECRRTAARNPPAPDVRRHATLPQSWMQRENWEFETHRRLQDPFSLRVWPQHFWTSRLLRRENADHLIGLSIHTRRLDARVFARTPFQRW